MRKITTDSLNWFWEKGIKPIKEKVENLKNTMDTMLKISEIVNNCVTDNPDLPLAAAQGKFLMGERAGLETDSAGASYGIPERHYFHRGDDCAGGCEWIRSYIYRWVYGHQ